MSRAEFTNSVGRIADEQTTKAEKHVITAIVMESENGSSTYVAIICDLMSCETRDVNGVTVVALVGDIDRHGSPVIRQQLLENVERHGHVIVDLSAIDHIDSSGVASLLEALQVSRKKGASFSLAGVSPTAMRVLILARLERVFTIYPSVAIALTPQTMGDSYSLTIIKSTDLTTKPRQVANDDVCPPLS